MYKSRMVLCVCACLYVLVDLHPTLRTYCIANSHSCDVGVRDGMNVQLARMDVNVIFFVIN